MAIIEASSNDCPGWRIVDGKSRNNIQAAAATPHSGYENIASFEF
jgi:hypothetical protein